MDYEITVDEDADGSKCWYLNGELHRVDGPAVEYANGDKYWYLNGSSFSFDEYLEELSKTKSLKEIMLLRLKYS